MTAAIRIEEISKRYDGFQALDDVSLSLSPGAYVVLLGPSGSGKTTLLSVLGGFTLPDQGRVLINGRDVTTLDPAIRPTTTVFQDYALFPHMTIGENVGFGLRMRKVGRSARIQKVAEMLELVGLPDAMTRLPHQLSGGQRQRVALARALAVNPAVLLLDEPLGALDLKLRRQMQDELKALQKRIGTTFVHVTHDQEEAMAIADQIVVLNKGRIEDAGSPEQLYQQPRTRFAAEFMGNSTLVPGKVESNGIATSFGILPLATRLPPGSAVTLCIRPASLVIGDAAMPTGLLPLGIAAITNLGFLGNFRKAELRIVTHPAEPLLAHLPPHLQVSEGDMVKLALRNESIAVIPAT